LAANPSQAAPDVNRNGGSGEVAARILPAVEPGFQPGGKNVTDQGALNDLNASVN